MDLCQQSNVSVFNILSRLLIVFLPRTKHLLISCLQSPSAVTLEPRKIKSVSVSIVSSSICHEVIEPDVMILVSWMLNFKPAFSLSSFTFIKRLFSSSLLTSLRVMSSAYLKLLIFLLSVLILACTWSSLAFPMIYLAYKLNKQDDNIQPWYNPSPIWNQSVVPCPVLTVASWPAYRFLRRQVRWSGIPNSLRICLGSITTKKASRCDGIPAELFQILKDDAIKILHSICQQIWKTQQWTQDWKMSVFIPIPKKGKKCSNCCIIVLISPASKVMLKVLQARLQQYVNSELPDIQTGFRKGRRTRDQTANICWITEKARKFQKKKKTSTSALLTMLKSLTVWITTNWKILKPYHFTCLLRNLYAG